MSDDRDPLISDALHRLARNAPAPRPDRLEAIATGAHRRQQTRITIGTLTAAAFVVAAAVGVASWHNTAVHSVSPNPASSPPPSASLVSSPPAATSAPAEASAQAQGQGGAQPTPTGGTSRSNHSALVVTVTAVTSVTQGDPATVLMTVTNNGSATTHGGTFVVEKAYAMNKADAASFQDGAVSPQCRSETQGLTCDVGILKPGQSTAFSDAITATSTATSIIFDVRWEYSPPTGAVVSTPFHQVVAVVPGVPSSQLPTPPSSEVPNSVAPSTAR
jgi:hypothetical protein